MCVCAEKLWPSRNYMKVRETGVTQCSFFFFSFFFGGGGGGGGGSFRAVAHTEATEVLGIFHL